MSSNIDPMVAQDIFKALRSGTVPPHGLEHFAVGLDDLMAALEEEFAYVASGRCVYRFIRGSYGSGKTFLSSLLSSRALEAGFLTSNVVVTTAETQLYKLHQIYRKACLNLSTTSHRGGALQSLIDRWLYQLEERVVEFDGIDEEDERFLQAVAGKAEQALQPLGERAGRMLACLTAYHKCQMNGAFGDAKALLDWMSGEEKVGHQVKRLANVTGTLDNSDALIFLRGLLELIRAAGHKGLVLVLDEVEIISRLHRPERLKSLEVLRTLVDAIDKNEFPGLMLLITGTPDLFDETMPALPPLHDRIKIEFSETKPDNLRMPQVRLKSFDAQRLLLVARRLKEIFPAKNPERIQRRVDEALIQDMVAAITKGFGGTVEVVPRLFLREFVQTLDRVDQHDYDPRAEYSFDADRVAEDVLTPEEREYLDEAAKGIYL
jgi:hypothetical protein